MTKLRTTLYEQAEGLMLTISEDIARQWDAGNVETDRWTHALDTLEKAYRLRENIKFSIGKEK